MNVELTIKVSVVILTIVAAAVFATVKMAKQSKKDWAKFYDLEKRIKGQDLTKEQMEKLHTELVEFGKKVSNTFIETKLLALDGYLRGLYKQYQKD